MLLSTVIVVLETVQIVPSNSVFCVVPKECAIHTLSVETVIIEFGSPEYLCVDNWVFVPLVILVPEIVHMTPYR